MKEKRFKRGILIAALALLLLIPTGIVLAKFVNADTIGSFKLNITVDPPILDQNWQNELNTQPTKLVVDSFNAQQGNLPTGKTWEDGILIGEKADGNFTNGVRLFEVGNTAYILARGTGPVVFPTNSAGLFSRLSTVQEIQFNKINTSSVTDMSRMFGKCISLMSLDLSKFDTRNVTNMSHMFGTCGALTSLNLSSFNTAQVTEMIDMFGNCKSLTSLNLSSFNTAQVTDMGKMFTGCTALETVNLTSFDTRNVTTMDSMFSGCRSLTSLDLSDFDTRNVTNMQSMFAGCSSLTSLDLSSFDTSKAVSAHAMNHMFGVRAVGEITDIDGCDKLQVVTLGLKFQFETGNDTSYLPAQSDSNIPGADGKWYPAGSSQGYTPTELGAYQANNKLNTTYYAVKSEALAASASAVSAFSLTPEMDTDPVTGQNAGLSGGQNLTDPVTPVTPIDPAAPVDPVNPVTPVAPTDPEDPADPDDPVTTGEETGTGASQDNPTTTE